MVVVGVGAVAGVADAGVVVVPVAIDAVFLVVLAVIAVVVSCFVALACAESFCAIHVMHYPPLKLNPFRTFVPGGKTECLVEEMPLIDSIIMDSCGTIQMIF